MPTNVIDIESNQELTDYLKRLDPYSQPYFILIHGALSKTDAIEAIQSVSASQYNQPQCCHFKLSESLDLLCGEYYEEEIKAFARDVERSLTVVSTPIQVMIYCHNCLVDHSTTLMSAHSLLIRSLKEHPEQPRIIINDFTNDHWPGVKHYMDITRSTQEHERHE